MCFLCKNEAGIIQKISVIPKDLFIPKGKKKKSTLVVVNAFPNIHPDEEATLGPSAAEGESLWVYCLHRVLPLIGVLGFAVILKRRGRLT